MKHDLTHEEGISTVAVLVILLIAVTLGLSGFSIWSYVNYRDQKDNVDAKITTAVAAGKKDQQTTDNANFAEQAKLPNTTFNGPADFGSVSFKFPKTWSVYLGNGDDGSGGTYTGYFNPARVPTISTDQQFALRLTIKNQSYESVVASYASLVKKGTLKSSVIATNGLSGVRLDGAFTKSLDGSLVIFKVRDKTLSLQTDSPSFVKDFNESIIPSLTFTP